ncbi:hypothetical protein JCM16358_07920 [Halanaerocella petrolearia]
MKIWKLTKDVYAIKEYLDKKLFNDLLAVEGVSYNKEKWRIEFRQNNLSKIKKYVDNMTIVQGPDLINRLYRINKYKSRAGLMKNSIVIYEANDYIYFILQDDGFDILDDYEGSLLVADDKVKEYAKEAIYFNTREKLIKHQIESDGSIKDLIDVIDNDEGSFLFDDFDSSPFLLTSEYYNLELTNKDKETLFIKEVEKRRVDAFNLERLAERRNISREVWYPILVDLVEKEIRLRRFKLEQTIKKKGVNNLFADDKTVKLGIELDKLTDKISKKMDDYLELDIVKEYRSEKEKRTYGI